MAGYRITFDGSLVERLNVPQATTTNNFTSFTLVDGNDGEAVLPNGPNSWGPVASWSVVYPSFYPISQSTDGNILTWTIPSGGVFTISQNLGPGTYDIQMRFRFLGPTSGTSSLGGAANINRYELSAQDNGGGFHGWIGIPISSQPNYPTGQWITVNISWTFGAGQHIRFVPYCVNGTSIEFDYMKVGVAGPTVTISDTTTTEGVSPTGGTATTATPVTITNGQSGLSTPSKLFGARVVHDLSDVAEAKFYPPADNTQNADASISDTQFFTATDTSVSVEAEGLGSAERLRGGQTTIIVENTGNTVEN